MQKYESVSVCCGAMVGLVVVDVDAAPARVDVKMKMS
jgi:hypothetical protein